MSYKITIEETKTVTKVAPRSWVRLDADKGEMGYAPAIEQPQTERTDIYTQVVETLDLKAVISAINQMNRS